MQDRRIVKRIEKAVTIELSYQKNGETISFRTPTVNISERGALLRFPVPDPFLGLPINVNLVFSANGWDRPMNCKSTVIEHQSRQRLVFSNFDELDLEILRSYINTHEGIPA